LPVKPATQTNAIEQPSPQIYRLSTAKLKIGVSQQALASNSPEVVQTLCEAGGPPQALQQSLPSTLRILVEHHFGTAHLSVWIDEKLTYNYSLRGAVKKRMLLLKGVQGYFSDSVEVTGGEHLIRVRVLSEDNSYDQSGSIRGSFVPGSEKVLTTRFDKNNQGMRLSLQ
jgi:hypothetical protein